MVEEAVTALPSFCQVMLVGEPEAMQVKMAGDPNVTVTAAGCWVMVGGDVPAAASVGEEWEYKQAHFQNDEQNVAWKLKKYNDFLLATE